MIFQSTIPEGATPLDILNIVINKISSDGLSITECKQLTDFAQIKQQLLDSQSEQGQLQPTIEEEVVVKHLDKFNEAMRHINEHREREDANYEQV